ncbi:MAG TPA: aminopeptidase N [Oleiagrimonas sp.]|nr:aminopeptidase N [Oleiagrimonas sp.]
MSLRHNDQHPSVRLADYRPPEWRVDTVALDFDLGISHTDVHARLHLIRDGEGPLTLDGEKLDLVSVTLDGKKLDANDYDYDGVTLTVPGASDGSVLETHVRLNPSANTALEGLYLSGQPDTGFLLTQCEAQGFRHITFMPDRPDVQSRYTVTLRADKERFPVLLAGGNPDGAGELEEGRHWARFVDPHPKPTYLFALVAGSLEKISRDYTTADGREVTLNLWAEADAIEQCHFAMDSLERAMRWDEQTYGRNYDLSVFNVVATHDFNMGAMENKGLNIFNTSCLLADVETSTDAEFRRVEAVVAHEYFHNWSGNRVTCRDWFQLSLKEGFTVFREHGFSADMNSAPLKRIEDVALLRRAQFTEDAGPLAHPVRPSEYREINNFYTATVYEKGAELVRMLAGRLGRNGFRRGTNLYFERHDGQAATIEDFLNALGDANGIDLTPYLAWYGQAGTPRLSARGSYDADARRYTLTFSQRTPATPGQREKLPLPLPVKLALFDADGRRLPLRLAGEDAAQGDERVIVFDSPTESFVFEDIDAEPVPSLLRGLSAPATLEFDYSPEQLALLLSHDVDGYNRWDASQQLAACAYDAIRAGETSPATLAAWHRALGKLFADTAFDGALLATLLTPPGEVVLAERHEENDPAAVHAARERLLATLADHLGADALAARYQALHQPGDASMEADSQARRSLKQCLLNLLARIDGERATVLARAQYAEAATMTERLGALETLLWLEAGEAESADFRQRFAGHPLVLNKWFSAHARVPGEGALKRIEALLADPAFTLRNPNRARAVLGVWAQANPSGFHRADGAGYRLLAEQLKAMDRLNPQLAARVATAFNGWKQLEPVRRETAHAALAELLAGGDLSENLGDIVQRALQGG